MTWPLDTVQKAGSNLVLQSSPALPGNRHAQKKGPGHRSLPTSCVPARTVVPGSLASINPRPVCAVPGSTPQCRLEFGRRLSRKPAPKFETNYVSHLKPFPLPILITSCVTAASLPPGIVPDRLLALFGCNLMFDGWSAWWGRSPTARPLIPYLGICPHLRHPLPEVRQFGRGAGHDLPRQTRRPLHRLGAHPAW